MKKSRAYRAVEVKNLRLERFLKGREGQRVSVGLDVSKEKIFVVLRWGESDFERPWKVDNPLELGAFVELLLKLQPGREMVVAMEPTGTYGDPLRQALCDAGLAVHRVSPKAAHDYAEIFDGVPSQHDGKDAAVVAELAALGKSSPWPLEGSARDQELAYWVDRLDAQRRLLTIYYGRLEGLLARHWPEATRTLSLRSGVLLRCLARYGGPSGLAVDVTALDQLQRWSRGKLSAERIQSLLDGASASCGVRQHPIDVQRLQEHAEFILASRREIRACNRKLEALTTNHEVIQAQAKVVGVTTACVLWVHLGDPRGYDCGPAYRKAMGLNLKERSSGKWKGRLKITKRGHSQVRRWLYFAALRLSRQTDVKAWCEAKKARLPDDPLETMRALVGVMRKLALALYQVGARGHTFDPSLLFPGVCRPVPSEAA